MTDQDKNLLIRIARHSIAATVSGQTQPLPEGEIENTPAGGAFVTLRNGSTLRGCMGTFAPDRDLISTIAQVASSSARDPRFVTTPITVEELEQITIEISILSQPQVTADPQNLEVGVHGILIEHPRGRGCFLPHVATELGWDRETFLARCCQDKARLEADAWKDPQTQLYLFTADVFCETPSK